MTDIAERELSNTLEDDYGMAAMPAGGSGSGTTRPRPDVWAARNGAALVAEVKRRTSDWPQSVHLTSQEVNALQHFADRAGARPYIVIRPHRQRSGQDWHCYLLRKLHETPQGYSIRLDDLPGQTLDAVVGDGDG